MAPRQLLSTLLIAGSCLLAQSAHAQIDKSAAVVLFDEAQRLMKEGKIAEACPKFAESNRMDPQLGALLHLADCYERVGQYASAWAAFREAAELADRRADARSLSAKDRATALEAKLSRLTIVVPDAARVPGIEVRRDGVVVGAAIWGTAVPVDPGVHRVEVTAPGRSPWQEDVEIGGSGGTASVNVPVLAEAPGAPPSAPNAPVATGGNATGTAELDAGRTPGSTQRVLGWSAIGAGAVGVAVGVVFTLRRSSKLSDRDDICPSGMGCTREDQENIDELTDEARSAGTIGVIGFVGGALLAGGGVALVATAPKARPSASWAPILGPDVAGVTFRGAF